MMTKFHKREQMIDKRTDGITDRNTRRIGKKEKKNGKSGYGMRDQAFILVGKMEKKIGGRLGRTIPSFTSSC